MIRMLVMMMMMMMMMMVVVMLNDSEGHCVTVTDGECELDYLQSWCNSSESGDSTEGLEFSQKKNPRLSLSLMRPDKRARTLKAWLRSLKNQDRKVYVSEIMKTSPENNWTLDYEYWCSEISHREQLIKSDWKPRKFQVQIPRNTHRDLPSYSNFVHYVYSDFVTAEFTKVHSISADCKLGKGVAKELQFDLNIRDFVFKQRKNLGELAIIPPGTTWSYNNHIVLMVLIQNELDCNTPSRETLIKSLIELKTFLQRHKIGIISILVPDLNRKTPRRIFYSLLHNIFKHERIQIKAHTHFYESM